VKEVAGPYLPSLQNAYVEVSRRMKDITGSSVEDNKYSISAHYRNVESKAEVKRIEQIVDEEIGRGTNLTKTHGKMVFEIRPLFDWNKGKAVIWLIENIKERDGWSDVLPIYLGDDVTDEDAFRVLDPLDGLGIHIQNVNKPAETHASHVLDSTHEVQQFLTRLCSL